jgi:hypothetical protein
MAKSVWDATVGSWLDNTFNPATARKKATYNISPGLSALGSADAKKTASVANWQPGGAPTPIAEAGTYGGGYGSGSYDPTTAEVGNLRGEIKARGSDIQGVFDALFGALDTLLKERASQTEKDYGDQFTQAAKQYTDSIPKIGASYAAVGAADSTDNTYAKNDAKSGYEETNAKIGKNKEADLAKIGQYGNEQRGKYQADRDSVNRLVGRVDQTSDVGELRSSRNAIEDKIGGLQADKASLGTDQGARGQLASLTADNGRFDSIKSALDTIINGSMSGGVKQAAVQSAITAGGLSDEDKKKVADLYGNVYNAPAAPAVV